MGKAKKYKVITVAKVAFEYIIEADSPNKAKEKFYAGEWISAAAKPNYDIESEEYVVEVQN